MNRAIDTLKKLSHDDWIQRYQRSLVMYDGQVIRVDEVVAPQVFKSEGKLIKVDLAKFRLDKPPAGWFNLDKDDPTTKLQKSAYYLSYIPAHQYCRGFLQGVNVQWYYCAKNILTMVNTAAAGKILFQLAYQDWKTPKLKFSFKFLQNKFEEGWTGWAGSSKLFFTANNCIYYKLSKIGTFSKDSTHIKLDNPMFETELKEILPEAQIETANFIQRSERLGPRPREGLIWDDFGAQVQVRNPFRAAPPRPLRDGGGVEPELEPVVPIEVGPDGNLRPRQDLGLEALNEVQQRIRAEHQQILQQQQQAQLQQRLFRDLVNLNQPAVEGNPPQMEADPFVDPVDINDWLLGRIRQR